MKNLAFAFLQKVAYFSACGLSPHRSDFYHNLMPTPLSTNNLISLSTIDEVLAQLTQIIADAEKTGDRIGYFSALYYKVTAKVKEGIDKNEFENGPRMERLDVLFASPIS